MAASILSPSSTVLPNTAAILGVIPTVLGIYAISRPRGALGLLQFPAPKDPEAQKLADNLMRIYGGRDLAVGLATLVVWRFAGRRALGWLMVSQMVMPFADGWAARLQIGKGAEWMHLPFAAVGLGLGGGLLGLFGGQ